MTQPARTAAPSIAWQAQSGPQSALLSCPVADVFFGGARGGGKTDGMLGEWAVHATRYGRDARGVFFRRELTQLEEAIERAKQILQPLGAVWHEQKKTMATQDGARLTFRYLDSDSDAEKYQGHSYTRIYVEELTNFPSPAPLDRLKATLRSAAGVPCRFRATGNPGGPGHAWVKARYVDPAPGGYQVLTDEHGQQRVYIPSKLSDNRILTESDPHYADRIRASGSAALVRAWLDGDWSVVEGAYFDGWDSSRHVCRPFTIPDHWTRIVAMDWGSARPFSVGWYAVSDGSRPGFARGALVRYREWYGASAPNVGLKLSAEQVANGIRSRCADGERIASWVCDPAMMQRDGGPSIAERMSSAGIYWVGADNKRLPGWDQVRQRLAGDGDGLPMLVVFDTCRDLIRTLPGLCHDTRRPEDLDSDAEDHAADELRYACMSRPFVTNAPPPKPPKDCWSETLGEKRSYGWMGA